MATESIPETIGRYQIRRELGRGMMGVVYEAHDPSLNRPVALKVVRLLFAITEADKDGFERRFLSEARIAARLSHPGIVVVHDIGRDSETGILYIALERLQGRTLAEMTAEGARLPWRTALGIGARVAEALAYAHAHGVVHRDIKPANVMVLPTGEPKIMDFGLAKHEAGLDLTAAGQFVGTPLFMAPEQVTGQKVDGRTDLFCLGSVLYTLLTGTRPFAADSVHKIMNRVAHQDPPLVTEVCPDLPRVLDDVLVRALAKDPSERYPNGEAFAEDLEDVLAGRAPRHLKGWTRPPRAEGTLVAAREAAPPVRPASPEAAPAQAAVADADLPSLSLSLPPAPRRRDGRPLRTLALCILLAGLSAYYFSSEWPEHLPNALVPFLFPPSPSAEPGPSAPVVSVAPGEPADSPAPSGEPPAPLPGEASPGAEADLASVPAEAEAGVQEDPPPTVAGDAVADPIESGEALPTATPPPTATPGPTATPDARPTPPAPASPRPAPEAARPKTAPATASLTVRMEHHLRSGTVRVWLDNRMVVEEALDARVTKKVLFFSVRKGVVEERLKVAPGRREVRVQVKWDDNVEMKRIVGSFRSGSARQLEIRISRLGSDLSLAWK